MKIVIQFFPLVIAFFLAFVGAILTIGSWILNEPDGFSDGLIMLGLVALLIRAHA